MRDSAANYSDDDLLPISGLQHLAFCPRQCALIHLERLWSENFLTASGRVAHERVHSAESESRGALRIVRGLALRSRRLGLYGVADVVEFRRVESPNDPKSDPLDPLDPSFDSDSSDSEPSGSSPASETKRLETAALESATCETATCETKTSETNERESGNCAPENRENRPDVSDDLKSTDDETARIFPERPSPTAVRLPKRRGLWRPYPVEYKRGKAKQGNCDAVQLCAQAICLEETLGCRIPEGSLFYGQTRRRVLVDFNDSLRSETERLALEFHRLIAARRIPPASPSSSCKACSLTDECQPNSPATASDYLRSFWREAEDSL